MYTILVNIPTMLYVLIVYNLLMFSGENFLDEKLFTLSLISGAKLSVKLDDLLILLGIFALYIEVFKSMRTSSLAILEHTLSMLLFVGFLVELITIKQAGTSTFLILTLIQMVDVVAGFSITISAARRDVMLGGH